MQHTPKTLKDGRYHSIDFARGICILCVIISHYAWQDAERLKLLFPFWIYMSIPVFIVISGFVYTKSFHKRKIDTIGEMYAIDAILEKIVRYSVPCFIAFSIGEITFRVIGSIYPGIGHLLVPKGHFGPGSYYYPIMIQFIFYFPVIYAIIQKYDFKGLILCGFINLGYEILKHICGMSTSCYRLLIFKYTLLMAYGCYLAMGNYKRHKKLSMLSICIGISYILGCQYLGIVPPVTNYGTGSNLWACLFIIPISGPLILNKISNRFVEMLGYVSYDIYLVQMIYYNWCTDLIYTMVPNRMLQLIINLIVCVSVGLIFYYIETPITKIVNHKTYNLWLNYKKMSKSTR